MPSEITNTILQALLIVIYAGFKHQGIAEITSYVDAFYIFAHTQWIK